jgi:hypothetical protein
MTAGKITSDASAAQAKKSAPYFKKLLTGMHMGAATSSLREADYKGHHITIKTTYQITIDGKLFKGALGVSNAGTVHYHGMPNTGFASALDLVKAVIDAFPDEYAKGSGGGGGMDMPGMNMKKSGGRKKPHKKHSLQR